VAIKAVQELITKVERLETENERILFEKHALESELLICKIISIKCNSSWIGSSLC
jgi:hypothetical protein